MVTASVPSIMNWSAVKLPFSVADMGSTAMPDVAVGAVLPAQFMGSDQFVDWPNPV